MAFRLAFKICPAVYTSIRRCLVSKVLSALSILVRVGSLRLIVGITLVIFDIKAHFCGRRAFHTTGGMWIALLAVTIAIIRMLGVCDVMSTVHIYKW